MKMDLCQGSSPDAYKRFIESTAKIAISSKRAMAEICPRRAYIKLRWADEVKPVETQAILKQCLKHVCFSSLNWWSLVYERSGCAAKIGKRCCGIH